MGSYVDPYTGRVRYTGLDMLQRPLEYPTTGPSAPKPTQWPQAAPEAAPAPSGLFDFLSRPMTAGPQDRRDYTKIDELNRPVYSTPAGQSYTVSQTPGPDGSVVRAAAQGLMDMIDSEGYAGTAKKGAQMLWEGILQGVTAPGRALAGEDVTYGDAAATALDWAAPAVGATLARNGMRPDLSVTGMFGDAGKPAKPDISTMTLAGPKKGSAAGGEYIDPDGKKWVVKSYDTDLHAQNEVAASKAMQAAGLKVPDMETIDLKGAYKGGQGVASSWWRGQLTPFDKSNPAHVKAAQKDFGVHAILGNWDALGTGFDNTLIDEAGDAVMVDPGGSLLFRAMGSPKGDLFGDTVEEITTMRSPQYAPEGSQVYGKMTPEEVNASVADGVKRLGTYENGEWKLKPEVIKGLAASYMGPELTAVYTTLSNRLKDAAAKTGVLPDSAKPQPASKGLLDTLEAYNASDITQPEWAAQAFKDLGPLGYKLQGGKLLDPQGNKVHPTAALQAEGIITPEQAKAKPQPVDINLPDDDLIDISLLDEIISEFEPDEDAIGINAPQTWDQKVNAKLALDDAIKAGYDEWYNEGLKPGFAEAVSKAFPEYVVDPEAPNLLTDPTKPGSSIHPLNALEAKGYVDDSNNWLGKPVKIDVKPSPFGKAKNWSENGPKKVTFAGSTQTPGPFQNAPKWIEEKLKAENGIDPATELSLPQVGHLIQKTAKSGSNDPKLQAWLDNFIQVAPNAEGAHTAYATQTAAKVFDDAPILSESALYDEAAFDAFAANGYKLPEKAPAAPPPPKNTVTWQQVYDQKLADLKSQYLADGNADGPTTIDEVFEAIKSDDDHKASYIQDEIDNYYSQDYLQERLEEDFTPIADVDDDTLLEIAFKNSTSGFWEDEYGFPKPASLDELMIKHDPRQAAMPGIGAVPEGPNALGTKVLDSFKALHAGEYFDHDGLIPDVADNGLFDPSDVWTSERLGEHYDFAGMASDNWDEYISDMDEDTALSYLGLDEEDLINNQLAYEAEYGSLDDSDILYELEQAGYDGGDMDVVLPDDVDPMDLGYSGATSPSSGSSSGSSKGSSMRKWTDENFNLPLSREAMHRRAQGENVEAGGLMDVFAPETRENDMNLRDLYDAVTRMLADPSNPDFDLEEAVNAGFDLDMPVFHVGGGGYEVLDPNSLKSGGMLYTATHPSGAQAGSQKWGRNTNPFVFRGNIAGIADLEESVGKTLAEAANTGYPRGDGAPAFANTSGRDAVEKSIKPALKDLGLDEYEATAVAPHIASWYFDETPEGQIVLRPRASRETALKPGAWRDSRYGFAPDWSAAEAFEDSRGRSAYSRGLQKLGFDASFIRDEVESHSKSMRSLAVFKDSLHKLRHPAAKFDPALANSRNVMSSSGAAGILGYLLAKNMGQAQEDQQPELLGGNI